MRKSASTTDAETATEASASSNRTGSSPPSVAGTSSRSTFAGAIGGPSESTGFSATKLAGGRFTAREIPGGDAGSFLTASIASIPRDVEAVVTVDAACAQIEPALSMVDHDVVDTTADSCVIRIKGEDVRHLTFSIVRIALDAPVVAIEPNDVADAVTLLTQRLPRHRSIPARGRSPG